MTDPGSSDGRRVACPGCGATREETFDRRYPKPVRCLDCGTRFHVGPEGPPRRSMRAFWAVVVANLLVTVGLLSVGLLALLDGNALIAAASGTAGVLFAIHDAAGYREAWGYLTGSGSWSRR